GLTPRTAFWPSSVNRPVLMSHQACDCGTGLVRMGVSIAGAHGREPRHDLAAAPNLRAGVDGERFRELPGAHQPLALPFRQLAEWLDLGVGHQLVIRRGRGRSGGEVSLWHDGLRVMDGAGRPRPGSGSGNKSKRTQALDVLARAQLRAGRVRASEDV